MLGACSGAYKKLVLAKTLVETTQAGHEYRSFVTPSDSMEPAIAPHDYVLVDTTAYTSAPPQRGDIVAFLPPMQPRATFIKRIIALPGDAVAIDRGTIRVNGAPWRSPAIHPAYRLALANRNFVVDGAALGATADIPPRADWKAPDRLPAGCYLVIGDNAAASEDSHNFGCAEFAGTFRAGERQGQATKLIGKVVRVIPQ